MGNYGQSIIFILNLLLDEIYQFILRFSINLIKKINFMQNDL